MTFPDAALPVGPSPVSTVSHPSLVPALRDTWRKTAEQKIVQGWRFLRLFVVALVGQILTQLVTTLISGDVNVTQLGRKFIVSLVVGAAEVVWRQMHPAMTASQADSAPGTTIVANQVTEGDAAP